MPSFARQGSQIALVVGLVAVATANIGARWYNAKEDAVRPNQTVRIIKLALTDYQAGMTWVRESGWNIAGVDIPNSAVDILVDDIGAEALGRSLPPGIKLVKDQRILATTPDAGFHTAAEVATELAAIAQRYPELTQLRSIGHSLEGRDIWAIKIATDPEVHHPERPVILFNAMHHAREVMTTEVAMDTVHQLTQNYGVDERVTRWLTENEVWVIPMFNVDGNNKVWTSYNMWRKNTRGGYGVDINRNYPYRWADCGGSSNFQGADDYHGPSAASEPETQAMMNFVGEVHPVFSISYHSYSELVIWPFSCDGQHTPTRAVIENVGRTLASMIPRDSGQGTYTAGTAWELLYPVDGGDLDYLYATHNVVPFVIELNSSSHGFQPSFAQTREPTVRKLRAAWGYLIDQLGASGIRGIVRDSNGAIISSGTATVSRASGPAFSQTVTLKSDGSFHVVVLPGGYNLSVQSAGRTTFAQSVTVGSQRVDVNVDLN